MFDQVILAHGNFTGLNFKWWEVIDTNAVRLKTTCRMWDVFRCMWQCVLTDDLTQLSPNILAPGFVKDNFSVDQSRGMMFG